MHDLGFCDDWTWVLRNVALCGNPDAPEINDDGEQCATTLRGFQGICMPHEVEHLVEGPRLATQLHDFEGAGRITRIELPKESGELRRRMGHGGSTIGRGQILYRRTAMACSETLEHHGESHRYRPIMVFHGR